MLSHTFKIASAILLVSLSIARASPLMCDAEMDEDACKMEFMKHMDNEVKEEHIDVMKYVMFKMTEAFKAMMKEMPADDPHTKMMSASVDAMKTDMEMMDKMMDMNDRMKMQEMIVKFYKDMRPNFDEAQKEDATNAAMFKKMTEKYNYNGKLIEEAMMKFMGEFEEIWTELYDGLREKDVKKYTEFMAMNDMMSAMKAAGDRENKAEMMVTMMRKMMKFHETPYMMAMMMGMCNNCEL